MNQKLTKAFMQFENENAVAFLELCYCWKYATFQNWTVSCYLKNVFYNTIIALFTISNILFPFVQLKIQASVLQNIFIVSRAFFMYPKGWTGYRVVNEILFPSLSVRNA